jgi:hypothetical protein
MFDGSWLKGDVFKLTSKEKRKKIMRYVAKGRKSV